MRTPYRCKRCPNAPGWRDIAQLEKHLRRVHYRCECGAWFGRKDAHNKHRAEAAVPDEHFVADVGRGEPVDELLHLIDITPERPDATLDVRRVPFVGFRCWRVYRQMPMLISLIDHSSGTDAWAPGTEMRTASCYAGCTAPPSKTCKCGFWVLNGLWDAVLVNEPEGPSKIRFHHQRATEALLVAGAAELSGKVIPGTVGQRGAVIRLLGLWVMPRLDMTEDEEIRVRQVLCDLYGVPVVASAQDLIDLVSERRAMYSLAEATDGAAAEMAS